MSEVELWLHPDILYYGIICAHPKLTVPYLKKVVSYAKAKGKDGGFPELSWTIWKHMAVNKMLMEETLAWTYFQIFFNLKNKSVKERLEFAELCQQLSETGSLASYQQHMKVPTLEFVLFLFMQQANKVSLRKSLLGEEWPGASPRLESPSHSSRSEATVNIVDERKHTQFIISHFSQIIEILSEGYKIKDSPNREYVASEVIKVLGYIIHGRIVMQNTVCTLYDIAIRHRIQSNSGYMRQAGCFSLHLFEQWLTKKLGENPFGLANCITSGTRLNWADAPSSRKENQIKKARIATNCLSAPTDNKLIFFSQCTNQTVARQTVLLNNSCVKIHRCHSAYFYLLSPLKCVSIEKCNNTWVVLGPVSTCVKIVNCQNVTLIAPCQSAIVSSSTGITLHITTPSQPVLMSDGVSSECCVTLAPYNTFYADLELHLAMVGLAISPNTDQWNNPICLGNRSNLSLSHSRMNDTMLSRPSKDYTEPLASENQAYRLVSPSQFYTFSIPFKTRKKSADKQAENGCVTEEIPGGLPKEYAQAVKVKQRSTERWRQAVKKSNMTREERTDFQKLVEEKFKEWVTETKNQRQLDDLGQEKVTSSLKS